VISYKQYLYLNNGQYHFRSCLVYCGVLEETSQMEDSSSARRHLLGSYLLCVLLHSGLILYRNTSGITYFVKQINLASRNNTPGCQNAVSRCTVLCVLRTVYACHLLAMHENASLTTSLQRKFSSHKKNKSFSSTTTTLLHDGIPCWRRHRRGPSNHYR